MQWYAIHVFSGHEKKIKKYLESEVERTSLHDQISRILIPAEDVIIDCLALAVGADPHVFSGVYAG